MNLKVIKTVVYVLGVLIFLALMGVFYGLYLKFGNIVDGPSANDGPTVDRVLAIPAGCAAENMTLVGNDSDAVVFVTLTGEACPAAISYNARSGAEVARYRTATLN